MPGRKSLFTSFETSVFKKNSRIKLPKSLNPLLGHLTYPAVTVGICRLQKQNFQKAALSVFSSALIPYPTVNDRKARNSV